MRNNKILGVAIAAALSLQVGVAQAVGLDNVNSTYRGEPDCVKAKQISVCVLGDDNVPHSSFDNVSDGKPLVNVPVGGIVYAMELFGGDGPPKLPNSDTKMVAVIYTLSTLTDIEEQLKIIFTLSDGVFAGQPKLAISDDTGGGIFDSLPLDTDGGAGKSSVTFLVDAGASKPLMNGDQLMLVYQFQKAASLATGGEVVLTAEVTDKATGGIVNPTRTVTIATSKQVVTTNLKAQSTDDIRISVSDDSKLFTLSGSGTGSAFINETTAQIGSINISNGSSGAYESDGETLFKVGEGSDGLIKEGTDTEGSTLTITNGQFAASLPDTDSPQPGKVYLNVDPEITGEVSDGTTTTFKLSNTTGSQISDQGDLGIRMKVDGTTAIGPTSTEVNPPLAVLTIDFEKDYVTDIGPTDAVTLGQIYKDGTVCVVYNVPSTEVTREKINIRVTNTSNVDGALSGKLYKGNGDLIGSKSLGDVTKDQTIIFNAATLEGIFTNWDPADPDSKRTVLEITSTLPKIEVLALMRNQTDKALLTNLSVGATGKACW